MNHCPAVVGSGSTNPWIRGDDPGPCAGAAWFLGDPGVHTGSCPGQSRWAEVAVDCAPIPAARTTRCRFTGPAGPRRASDGPAGPRRASATTKASARVALSGPSPWGPQRPMRHDLRRLRQAEGTNASRAGTPTRPGWTAASRRRIVWVTASVMLSPVTYVGSRARRLASSCLMLNAVEEPHLTGQICRPCPVGRRAVRRQTAMLRARTHPGPAAPGMAPPARHQRR